MPSRACGTAFFFSGKINLETRNAGKENLIFPQLSTINYQLSAGA